MRTAVAALALVAAHASLAGASALRASSKVPVVSGEPPAQQGGYSNPYCLTCRQVVNQLNVNADASVEEICEQFPQSKASQCNAVAKALKANRDVKTLVSKGCLDKTRKLSFQQLNETYWSKGAFDPRMRAGGECPGLLVCNILESVAGGPMCGKRLRAWGDFLKEDSFERPIRPTLFDTFPGEMSPPMSTPLPWYAQFFGDPKCDLCIDIVMALNREKESRGPDTCRFQPFSMQEECERQVETMRRNLDLRKIVLEGCVDATSLSPMEKVRTCALACFAYSRCRRCRHRAPTPACQAPGKCPPEVACNAVARGDTGGAYCGMRLRELGDFVAGGDSADQEIRNRFFGGAPLMSDSPFFPEGGAPA